MSGVRVLRLLEYIYASQEKADEDQQRWVVPANGSRWMNKQETIRSAVISQPFDKPHICNFNSGPGSDQCGDCGKFPDTTT